MLHKLVIISGMSGSGKSTALNAFEDLDFYAVDNLPITLFEKFYEVITSSDEFSKVAMVMDLRDSRFVENYPKVFRRVMQLSQNTEIMFLDANDDVLIRRFSETRRKHPLSNKSVAEGIHAERKLLSELKDLATILIDTTSMDVHALKKRVAEQFSAQSVHQMQIRIMSFGFKHGVPKNCDLIFDVRFLTNPHFVSELRDFTGLDKDVQSYIEEDPRFQEFLAKTLDYLGFLIPHYSMEGKSYLTIGIGCTGGKHRSVYLAECIGKGLKDRFQQEFQISLEHQDLRLQKA